MPEPLLRAYGVMRPRVEAMRLLDMVDAVAAGTGAMPKTSRTQLIGRARRTARGGGHDPAARQPKTLSDWASVGMEVVEEPAPTADPKGGEPQSSH